MSILSDLSDKTTYVFDFFHTLTDHESKRGNRPWTSDFLGIDREVWGEHLQFFSEDRLKGTITYAFDFMKLLVMRIDPTISDDKIREALVFRQKRFDYSVINIPSYVIETLKALKSKGKKLGLITNADYMELAAWDKCPIADLFDVSIHSFRVGMMKPEKEIYELCLKELNSCPEESVFVADGGSNELIGARECRLTTIMVEGIVSEFMSKDKISKRKEYAEYVVDTIADIL
ncbi:MAG: HAD-IA family hydrolase [Candidatus Delongbacteria bacterium]|jgi:putative hydrolase of the HAD superfamily|nr:HAD-IA family hydrolase [Candidatus Delongbacteria bacterium]